MPKTDASIRYVANSEIQTFKKCKRKWWLAYWRKLTPKKEDVTGVRGIGTRLHEALRVRYRVGGTAAEAIRRFEEDLALDLASLLDSGQLDVMEALRKDGDLCRAMLEGYFQWVEEEGVDIGLEIIGDEMEVSASLEMKDRNLTPVYLLGRLDVRARREVDGARFFIDHKSVGSFSQATSMLHMDEQMLMYHLLEMLEQVARGLPFEETERCDGGIYNMLRRVKRTARAKPPFYAREEIRHNIHEMRAFYQRVHNVVKDILEFEVKLASAPLEKQHLVAYPSPSRDCVWSCDFVHVCPMFDDGSFAEGFLTTYFVGYDPLARYATESNGVDGETDD